MPVGHALLVQVMSSLAVVVNAFGGHTVHESALEKVTNGFDINVPGEQHPKRPVTDYDSHWPPHKVRLNPLFKNT